MVSLANYLASISTSPGPTSTATPMPVTRAGHGAAAWAGKVLVAGGNLSGPGTSLYDYATDTWSAGPALAGAKGWCGSCQVGSVLHLVGGVVLGAFSVDHVYCDLANLGAGWQAGTILPAARSYHATVWDGTNMRILGGRLGSPSSPGAPTTDHFDLAGNGYAALPQALYDLAGVWHQGKLYTFGGLDASGNSVTNANVYDPAANTWSALTPLPASRARMAAYSDGTFIHLIGGYQHTSFSSSSLGEWQIYDPATDTWSLASTGPQPSYWDGVVGGPSPHRPIAFFGGTDSAAHSYIQTQLGAFAQPAPTLTLVSQSPSAPQVGQSVTLQVTIDCNDAGPVDWVIDWGEFDPATSSDFVSTGSVSGGVSTFTVTHAYATAGSYAISGTTVEHEPPLRSTATPLSSVDVQPAAPPEATIDSFVVTPVVGDATTIFLAPFEISFPDWDPPLQYRLAWSQVGDFSHEYTGPVTPGSDFSPYGIPDSPIPTSIRPIPANKVLAPGIYTALLRVVLRSDESVVLASRTAEFTVVQFGGIDAGETRQRFLPVGT